MDSPVLLRRFGPGDVIVRPEEPALSVFIVHTGVVEVRSGESTRRLGAGEMFGEAGVILRVQTSPRHPGEIGKHRPEHEAGLGSMPRRDGRVREEVQALLASILGRAATRLYQAWMFSSLPSTG